MKKFIFSFIACVLILALWIIYFSPGSRDAAITPKVASEVAKQSIVNITDDQIYREFERCMNSAKRQIGDDKLEARRQAAFCMVQLAKYGDRRAKRAFNIYFDLD